MSNENKRIKFYLPVSESVRSFLWALGNYNAIMLLTRVRYYKITNGKTLKASPYFLAHTAPGHPACTACCPSGRVSFAKRATKESSKGNQRGCWLNLLQKGGKKV